jgi:hypothetical protein
LALQSAVEDI